VCSWLSPNWVVYLEIRRHVMLSRMHRRGSLDEGKIKVGLSFVVCGEDRGWLARTSFCNVNLPVMYKPFA
jgi:hypothetical protein